MPLGKIMLARRNGLALPIGWAADEEGVYRLIALPLRIAGADSSPVRAVLIR